MNGLYLYCIREKNDTKFSAPGIDGGEVFVIGYQDLEAVVSEVFLKKFGSAEIQKKAQEDLSWIKEKAQAHERILEQAMRKRGKVLPVVPMKFGTIFKAREKLLGTLKKHYSQFKKSLDYLAGKQEWAVKVYLNHKVFGEDLKKASPMVQEKEKEIAQLPEGTAYFMQKQIDEAVSKEADKALENYTESFFESIKKYTEVALRGKILEKELTGKTLPMVLNGIFLVLEGELGDFVKEIDKLNKDYKTKGFAFESSGPWPAYNFV